MVAPPACGLGRARPEEVDMAITVKPVTLWRRDVDNVPGVLAETLGPLADAGVTLRAVMGYRLPDDPQHSVVEVWPIAGRRATQAAERVGLRPTNIPCLLIEGNDRPGLGAEIGRACAEASLNIAFCMALAQGRRFVAAIGFTDAETAGTAVPLLRTRLARRGRTPRAGGRRKPARGRRRRRHARSGRG
jgi:hypothetical protein